MVWLGNRTIAINLVPDFLVGGLCPPDFLLVGATSRSRPGGRNQRYECHLGIPRLQNARGAMNCATTNAHILKLTLMVRLGNRTYRAWAFSA